MRTITLFLGHKVISCEHNDFQTDDWKTQVQEILTVCLSFGSKETNIDELVDDDVQDAERDNAAFDDAHASDYDFGCDYNNESDYDYE